MYRDFFTNRWVLGGVAFLIVFSVACFLWYHYDTAPDKRDTAEAERIARQLQDRKEANTDNIAENYTNDTQDSSMLSKEIPQSEITDSNYTKDLYDMNNTEDTGISLYGFGPYPDVPEDYFRQPSWLRHSNLNRKHSYEAEAFEIMDRVLIKLWNQGHKNITGASFDGEKVFPHYANTAYVQFEDRTLPDGTVYRRITRVKGGPDINPFARQIMKGNIPAHIKLLDYNSKGIDPFTFLKGKN